MRRWLAFGGVVLFARRFSIEVREGRTYAFFVRDAADGPLRVSGPRVTIAGVPAPVKLTIERAR